MSTTGEAHGNNHVVHFYESDLDLVRRVAGYLGPVIAREEGAVIVIATPEHRAAVQSALAEAGCDVGAARADGRYFDVDAAGALAGLLSSGWPDRESFEETIGTLVAKAASGGGQVLAFGEMVGLLWQDGQAGAAIELERLWEELGRRYPFGLYCAYPAALVAGEGVMRICLCHQGTVGPAAGVEIGAFPCTPDAPAAARHFAVAAARRLGAGHLADDVALVVAELAANAMLHARSALTVTLQAYEDTLRIAVRDNATSPAGSLRAERMHGLGLVAQLATRWGVQPLGSAAKAVWADLAVTRLARPQVRT